MKICPEFTCREENSDDAEFCDRCGLELPVEAEVATDVTDASADAQEAVDIEQKEEVDVAAAEDVSVDVGAIGVEETDNSEEEYTDEIAIPVEDVEEQADDIRTIEPHLVVVSTGDKILLTKEEAIIGREDPISSIFPDIDTTPFGGLEGGVSRKHARVYEKDGAYYIEDLNSTNYTLINKQKMVSSSSQQLVVGDEIRLGRVALLFML
jgi:hypothetical protein